MYNLSGFAPRVSYFGASNSFKGFNSRFPAIFNPQKFDHIYIIKSGPGTGKSSLMRAIGAYYGRQSIYTEAIYCSSDPSSLDGIIVEYLGKRIAILDGTAPHDTDPLYPVAKEEIVNLGVGLDRGILERAEHDIISLIKSQSVEYKKAYGLLGIAGEIFENIHSLCYEIVSYCLAEQINNKPKKDNSYSEGYSYFERIEGSFSKNGYLVLDSNENISPLFIGPSELLSKIALSRLITNPHLCDNVRCICPSPLCGKMLDRIYLSDRMLEYNPDASKFNIIIDMKLPMDYQTLESSYYSIIEAARLHLCEASKYHMELEDIYKRAMCFEICEEALHRLTKDIDNLFSR